MARRIAREFSELVGGINGRVQPCPNNRRITGFIWDTRLFGWLSAATKAAIQGQFGMDTPNPRQISIWNFGACTEKNGVRAEFIHEALRRTTADIEPPRVPALRGASHLT
jgi:hypothetical protein